MHAIVSRKLIVGMEVHVELATRTKMFSRVGSPAHAEFDGAPPNSLIDPVVLALPGALPVVNRAAVEMAMMVGLALGCRVAPVTKWDRKSYAYADLPKGYQISQYDLPLCFDGAVDLPGFDEKGEIDPTLDGRRIGIIRAHLEEDAGKLLHEAPGGHAIDFSIVDLNRAGTTLLEIVTQPDFRAAEEAVAFARLLRRTCRGLGVSECVMQKGQIRFEPNINMELTLEDGKLVKTPIVEVKNLNSFQSLRGAIEYEAREQPGRWVQDGREMGPGAKSTRGWDAERGVTTLQREKEDAHDYRYFPDPDLPWLEISEEWRESARARVGELPLARVRRYMREFDFGRKEAEALAEEPLDAEFFDAAVGAAGEMGVAWTRAGKAVGNVLLQTGAKLANERAAAGGPGLVSALGISAWEVAAIAALREGGKLGNQGVVELFGACCQRGAVGAGGGSSAGAAESLRAMEEEATRRGLIVVRDDAALAEWVRKAIEMEPQAAADVRAGKQAAIGRLVGAVMKQAGGRGDAKAARERILEELGG